MKRETLDLIFGLGVLALGLVVLLFTFSQAYAIAQNPGNFFRAQLAEVSPQVKGPTADFTYSGLDLNVTFTDKSTAGATAITSWSWNFGDNNESTMPSPSHRFFGYGPWQVSLTVTDGNGLTSQAFAQVTTKPQSPTSGVAVDNAFGGAGGFNVNLDVGTFLIPVGLGLLTASMFVVMALVGGLITKAGWNMLKPRPETIRIRLKPKLLTQAFEEDNAGPPAPPPPS